MAKELHFRVKQGIRALINNGFISGPPDYSGPFACLFNMTDEEHEKALKEIAKLTPQYIIRSPGVARLITEYLAREVVDLPGADESWKAFLERDRPYGFS